MKYHFVILLCNLNVINYGVADLFNEFNVIVDNAIDGDDIDKDSCMKNVITDYREAQSYFIKKLFGKLSARSDNHFVFSPNSIWLSLSALAEGADPSVKSNLLSSLYLSKHRCMRYTFYDIALFMEEQGADVSLLTQRKLILDENLKVDPIWIELIKESSLLYVASAPIKSKAFETSVWLKKVMNTQHHILLRGKSIVLNTLDFQGLWTTSFESTTDQAPFYNDLGQEVGRVDMMNTRKRVRVAYFPFMNIKVLSLPIGINGRYAMIIAVATGKNFINNVIELFSVLILDIFSTLSMTLFPMDIHVPRFEMSTEFDVRTVLEESGIDSVWRDPEATRYVSQPAPIPGSLIQRVTIKFDSRGIEPVLNASDTIEESVSCNTSLESSKENAFIVNRPFIYALFNMKSHTCAFIGVFSKPYTNI